MDKIQFLKEVEIDTLTLTGELKGNALSNSAEIKKIKEDLSQLSSEKIVLYSEQNLTAEQKAQARANIGAAEDSILEMVDSIEDCIDTSKRYVLPDGYVYAWTYGEHTVESKNHILSSINSDGTPYNGGKGYKEEYRLNSSGVEFAVYDGVVSGFIPYNGEDVELRIPNRNTTHGSNYFHIYDSNFGCLKKASDGTTIDGSFHTLGNWVERYGATATVEDATITTKYVIPKESIHEDTAYIRVSAQIGVAVNSSTFDLALNEGLDDSKVVVDYSWQNTGLYYGSPDTGNRLDELETAVNNHEERLTTLESGSASDNDTSTDVPEYWKEHLSEKADAIQIAMEKAGRNKSAFLWYTDAHWVNGNSKVSPKLLNYLYMNTPMNKVNFGGDIIGDTLKATREEMKYLYEWRKAIKDLPNHHSVFGNHDMFNLDTVDYEDDNYRYAFLLAPEETSDQVWGDSNYYYIDNPAEKTRYLYIAYLAGNGEAMMKQGQFICDAMKAVPEGWHIVAIAHRWWQYSASATPTTGAIPAYEADMLSVFDAYNARKTRSGSNYFNAQDFTQAKGKVEFCIGGHIHVDYDIESEGGIPIIITTADANQNRVPDSTVDSGTIGTTTEAAVFGIIADYNDVDNTKITVVGVGRGTSRVVRPSSIKPTSISNITYSGNTAVGANIDKSKFSFTVNYSNGTTDIVNGATSVSPATISVVGDNTVTITYTEGGTSVTGTTTIIGEEKVFENLFKTDDPDIALGHRIRSTGETQFNRDGQLVTGWIRATAGATFTVTSDKGYDTSGNSYTGMCATYKNDKSVIAQVYASSWNEWNETKTTGIITITDAEAYYVRFCIEYTDINSIVITSDVAISPDEPDEPVVPDEPAIKLLSLNRTYEAGTIGEGLENHLDESKAYTNVLYGALTFHSASNTVSDITENSVTLKEPGAGGITIAYAIHLPDIATNDYKLTFNYSGTGKCRTYYRYAKVGDKSSSSPGLYINDTAGASGSAEAIIPKNTDGYDWVIIMLGSNTSGTKTFENVSLMKVE